MIMTWVLDLLEELTSIREEKRMLDHRKKLSNGEFVEENDLTASKKHKRLVSKVR